MVSSVFLLVLRPLVLMAEEPEHLFKKHVTIASETCISVDITKYKLISL